MLVELAPMEKSREEPELVNRCPRPRSQSEIVPSPALNKENTKLETDIVETLNLNESDQNIYPSLVTKVFVGVGLALAVFLVF